MTTTIKSLIIALILSLGTNSLFAGAGHSHNASEKRIESSARNKINKLIALNKIDKSWLKAKLLKMKKQNGIYGKEWVVSFKNKDIKDEKKQTLYIYLTTFAKVKGVNFKGN